MGEIEIARGVVLSGAALGATITISLILGVLLIIAYWRLFTKAGEKGWKSIIPIYNGYMAFKIAWAPGQFWPFLITYIIGYGLTGTYRVAGIKTSLAEQNPVFAAIGLVALIIAAVWAIRLCVKTAHAYGKGTGWGVLMIFFPYIVLLILAFGSAEYVGPDGKSATRGVR